MRVLLVSGGSGSRGGGEGFLEYLGMALTDRGHKVLMWIPNHERMDELATRCARFSAIMRSHYTNTYDYSGRSLSTCFNWGTSRRIASEWDAIRPDVIHINKQNLEDGLDLLRAARFASHLAYARFILPKRQLTSTQKWLGYAIPLLIGNSVNLTVFS